MSNVLHNTPAKKLHQTLTMIYPFYYISMFRDLFTILFQIGAKCKQTLSLLLSSTLIEIKIHYTTTP